MTNLTAFGNPIKDWELSLGAAEYERVLFLQKFSIERPVRTPDGRGGRTTTYEIVYQDIPGIVEDGGSTRPKDIVSGGGQKAETFWQFILPLRYNVQPTDRFVYLGETYELITSDQDTSFFITCLCRRIDIPRAILLKPRAVSLGFVTAQASLLRGIFLFPSAIAIPVSVKSCTISRSF